MVELGHRAVALDQGVEQSHHGIDTDAVTLCEFGDVLLSLRSKSLSEKSLCRIPVAEWPIDMGGFQSLEHQVHRTYPYHRLA
jgi:hypothetical protein